MSKIIKPIRTESLELQSNLSAAELAEQMRLFRKNNSHFNLELILGKRPNLDVSINSSHKVEISPLWQLTQIPALGMNVKIRGSIVTTGNYSKISGTIKPHLVYALLFWGFLFIGVIGLIAYTLRLTESIETLFAGLVFIFLVCPAILLFCSYNKKQLISRVSNTFSLVPHIPA
jgi:hypothetical protein